MKLRTKFSLLTCSLAVFIVAGVAVFFYIEEKNLLISELKKSKTETTRGLAEVGKESIISSNEILVLNYIAQIKKRRGVEYAMLTTVSGEILAHSDINLLGKIISLPLKIDNFKKDDLISGSYVNEDDAEIAVIASGVIIGEDVRGVAWVGFSQEVMNKVIDEALKKTKKRVAGVAGFGLIIGFLGSVILSTMMSRPIKKMARGAQSIGEGKLDTIIDVKSKDELGNLARDLNKMAKKLAELDEMKQDFVSSITHEFRSPLNAMSIHFDLLFKEKLGVLNEKQKNSIDILKNNARRLEKFINDLLDIAKIERGKMDIVPEVFDASLVIKEIHSLYKVQADKKKIEFNLSIADGLPQVFADPDRTKQILTNLVSNAIKFTPEEGRITISAAPREDDFVEFAIKDTGMGIPHDQIKSIFNKFEQVKGVRNKIGEQKGTGLGLAIVKSIVEAQGGDIRLESTPGKGSTFRFTLRSVKKNDNSAKRSFLAKQIEADQIKIRDEKG